MKDLGVKAGVLLLALGSPSAFSAPIPVTITFNVPSASYLADVELSRFNQIVRPSPEGTLTAQATSAATTIAISGPCPAANVAVIIDQEPMLVTSGSGSSVCTVTRNSALAQAGTVSAAHAQGAPVVELLYPTAQKYFIQVGVQGFMAGLIQNLGASSVVNGSAVTNVLTNQSVINSALTGLAQ